MEQTLNVNSQKFFSYHGTTAELFKIYIINALLTLITLGLYYPWAKAKILSYHFSSTEFKGDRFSFHGTGNEMFKGFVKAIILFGSIFLLIQLDVYYLQNATDKAPFIIVLVCLYLLFISLIPLAIVGATKYRASRTSWRGIHFQYTGTVKHMYKVFFTGLFFTIITLGIYAVWWIIDIITEIVTNLKFGDISFKFTGSGGTLFGIQFLGTLLMYITLGIYFFKLKSKIHNFHVDNFRIHQGKAKGTLVGETTGMGFFKLLIPNILAIVFTFGLAIPWATIRTMKYIFKNTRYKGRINFDNIQQGDIEYINATGEGMFDILELDLS